VTRRAFHSSWIVFPDVIIALSRGFVNFNSINLPAQFGLLLVAEEESMAGLVVAADMAEFQLAEPLAESELQGAIQVIAPTMSAACKSFDPIIQAILYFADCNKAKKHSFEFIVPLISASWFIPSFLFNALSPSQHPTP
jgi:hypothetical protein